MSDEELEGTFWFCLKHRRVERFEETDSSSRLGPFATSEAAQNALATAAEREKRYEAEDAAWEDGA